MGKVLLMHVYFLPPNYVICMNLKYCTSTCQRPINESQLMGPKFVSSRACKCLIECDYENNSANYLSEQEGSELFTKRNV